MGNRKLTNSKNGGQAAQTCLVVDDEDAVRDVAARGLRRFGYTVLTAASAHEALEILDHEDIPVMLSDVRMPGIDGIELLRRVRTRHPDVAVVLATSISEVSVAVECLRLGAHDFLTKPFQLDDLRARLEQAQEKQRLISENRRYQLHLEDMVRDQAARLEELFLEGVQTLAHAMDAKDSYTQGHSERVKAYSGAIARELGLSPVEVQLTELGAELHDIGKIGVGDDVLLKPGRLTEDEYTHLMEHTIRGEQILAPLLKNAPLSLAIVRWHHERLDGTGFPDQLAGDQIPVPVRIVTLADSFDAMTTARPYRDARSTQWALEEVDRCIGTQFDPDVVAAFGRAYPAGTQFPIPTPDKLRLTLPKEVAGVGRLT